MPHFLNLSKGMKAALRLRSVHPPGVLKAVRLIVANTSTVSACGGRAAWNLLVFLLTLSLCYT